MILSNLIKNVMLSYRTQLKGLTHPFFNNDFPNEHLVLSNLSDKNAFKRYQQMKSAEAN